MIVLDFSSLDGLEACNSKTPFFYLFFPELHDASYCASHRGLNRAMNGRKCLRNTYFTEIL